MDVFGGILMFMSAFLVIFMYVLWILELRKVTDLKAFLLKRNLDKDFEVWKSLKK
jgi:hypothetical protein